MLSNRSIPECTVIPQIPYPNIGEAIDWLRGAFGFTLRLRIANHRAQMNVGDGAVVLVESDGGAPAAASVMVRVDDVNGHYAHALKQGVQVLRPPAGYPYGERQYSVLDFAGHRWDFTQSIADVDPTEWGGTLGER